ncbi:TRAP transporter small permease [Roseomonas sp. M0104]|uniref:TRAP transporter small permease protein n=1 Tax=Teichococcus coralli TaxID=2545983 RepID=A0A845B6T4_9PROT|nr:TRAP transporter small permease [Pseudoroseomonas coralli]MXP62901.1 TRAP transporter small permease [Pseudoroseomonas coralli]
MASPVLHPARAAPSSGVAPAVLRFSDGIATASGAFASLCLVALLLLILAEVGAGLLGKLFPGFGGEITVAWEYGAYLMGAVFLFGAAAGLRAGTHIRVAILLARAGRGFTLVLELAATLIGLFVTGFLAWALVQFALRAWSSGRLSSGSLTPLWIPDAVLALGAILLAVQMATRLVRVLLGLPTEDESLKAGSVGE